MPLIPSNMNPTTSTTTGDTRTSTSDWSNRLVGKTIRASGPSDETGVAKTDLPLKHRLVDAQGGMMSMDHVPDR